MKRLFNTLAVVGGGALIGASGSSASAQNLLVDPSFELMTASPTGTGGWGTFNGAAFSNAQAHTGVESMFTPGGAGGYTVPGAYQIVAGVPGDTYTLSGWVFTPDTVAAGSNSFAILQISWYQTPTGGTAAGAAGATTVGVDVGSPSGTPPAGTVTLPTGTWTFASVTGVDPTSTPPSGPGGLGVGAYLLNINPPTPNANDFYFDDISLVNDSVVPEPASLSLVGLPLIGMALRRRRR
jgi:hypothetical protein